MGKYLKTKPRAEICETIYNDNLRIRVLVETHIFDAAVMIAFVRGDFALKTPTHVIVDVNGVGYDLHISLNTYSAINDKGKGQLFTYLPTN